MVTRHFIKISDFSQQEYLQMFKLASQFQKEGNFTHLCSGKVLAALFFAESTRTSSIYQSAIVKLGGGWVGFSSPTGTYVKSGEEDVYDTIRSYATVSNIMVIRHNQLNLEKVASQSNVPVINALCGRDEHPSAAMAEVYSIFRKIGKVSGLNIGFYGAISASRPLKSYMKIFSLFGNKLYSDSVTKEFSLPLDIQKFIKKNGGQLVQTKLTDFLPLVDLLIIDGTPQKGTPEKLVKEFNKGFETITSKEIALMKKTAVFQVIMPRYTTEGKSTLSHKLDNHPQNHTLPMLTDWLYAAMAQITFLLKKN